MNNFNVSWSAGVGCWRLSFIYLYTAQKSQKLFTSYKSRGKNLEQLCSSRLLVGQKSNCKYKYVLICLWASGNKLWHFVILWDSHFAGHDDCIMWNTVLEFGIVVVLEIIFDGIPFNTFGMTRNLHMPVLNM